MKRGFRKWLSKKRAIAAALVGKESGFFAQYAYMSSVQQPPVYPDVDHRCRNAEVKSVLDVLAEHDADFATDTFWRSTTRHLGVMDSVIDYAVVRAFRPDSILEIGSGRSTQIMARAINDNGSGAITCIDPAPRLNITDLPITFHQRTLRADDVALAAALDENDILFIDSSHILQPGTDVDIELNILFPALKPGVLVHVHDIFLPWGYPAEWAPRNWNEASGLIPWISSGAFEIVFPSFYMLRVRTPELRMALPQLLMQNFERSAGSFWMRRR